jgi:hypothetical protein
LVGMGGLIGTNLSWCKEPGGGVVVTSTSLLLLLQI